MRTVFDLWTLFCNLTKNISLLVYHNGWGAMKFLCCHFIMTTDMLFF